MNTLILSALIIAIIVFEILVSVIHPEKWLMSVPVIIWMLHSLVFRIMIGRTSDILIVNNWSTMLRTQGYLTLLSISIYRYIKYSKIRGKL